MAARGRTGAGFECQRRLAAGLTAATADDLGALWRRSHARVAHSLTNNLQRRLGVLA